MPPFCAGCLAPILRGTCFDVNVLRYDLIGIGRGVLASVCSAKEDLAVFRSLTAAAGRLRRFDIASSMSALGQSRRFAISLHVRLRPIADIPKPSPSARL